MKPIELEQANAATVERMREIPGELELSAMRAPISSALKHDLSGMSVWQVLESIHRGEYGVLRVLCKHEVQAYIVTTVVTIYPQRRVLHVVACGGGMLEVWLDKVVDELKLWAKDLQCDMVTLTGREGWERVLRTRNFKRRSVQMVLEL